MVFAVVALVCRPLEAQGGLEWQLHALFTVGADRFMGAGVGLAQRTGGRLRLGGSVTAGDFEAMAAARVEVSVAYLMNPFSRDGVTPYAGGGAAFTFTSDESREFILVVIGFQGRPGSAVGWFIEGGVAGGIRLAAGVRVRKRRRGP